MFKQKSFNWLPGVRNNNDDKKGSFRLYLGCEKELNTLEVRNTNKNDYTMSTKIFEVSASNSTIEPIGQVIFRGEMEDSRNKDNDNNKIQRFHFNNTLAQYVQFHLLEYYGDKGGGLCYFNVDQDINEYINQRSDFPSLSHDKTSTGFMCGDIQFGMRIETSYSIHEDVTEWSQCQEICLNETNCRAWSLGSAGNCKLSYQETRMQTPQLPNRMSGLRHCKFFQSIFFLLNVTFQVRAPSNQLKFRSFFLNISLTKYTFS